MRVSLFVLLTLVTFAPTDVAAQVVRPFPMVTVGDDGADGLRLALDATAAGALSAQDRIRLTDVPLPDGLPPVTLTLQRVLTTGADTVLRVDDATWEGVRPESGSSMWAGAIDGVPGSDVFVAFSGTGTRGWIDGPAGLIHLLAEAGPSGNWNASTTRVVSDARMRELGAEPNPLCATTTLPTPDGSVVDAVARPGPTYAGTVFTPVYEAFIAVETDTAFFKLFGDVTAAQTYAVTLLGAVSSRYREQTGVVITIAYLQLYTGADPWITQDVGGNSLDLLFEFQAAWDGGDAPVPADLYHFVSGASLGGGVAYVPALCNQDYAFGVSGNIGGVTPFPISVGLLNWDFMVIAHELGHNFSSPHTHSFCPPLDECAPDGYWGQCQDEQLCTNSGTIMSYCHLCKGGLDNITTYFHPDVVTTIRNFVVDYSCLQPFHGVLAADAGNSLAGTGGTASLDASFTAPDTMILQYTNAPGATGFLVIGFGPLFASFKGGVLVPTPDIVVAYASVAGDYDIPVPFTGATFPTGLPLWVQTWFADPGGPFGFSATNGLATEVIISDPWPSPTWIAHPSNGMEYALSNPGSVADIRAEAQSLGAELAAVEDAALNAWFVTTFDGTLPYNFALIGYSDELAEGTFVWDSGSLSAYTNWAGGEPNDAAEYGEDYVEMDLSSGPWNDIRGDGHFTNHGILQRPQ